jgi:hypothetical protein
MEAIEATLLYLNGGWRLEELSLHSKLYHKEKLKIGLK